MTLKNIFLFLIFHFTMINYHIVSHYVLPGICHVNSVEEHGRTNYLTRILILFRIFNDVLET